MTTLTNDQITAGAAVLCPYCGKADGMHDRAARSAAQSTAPVSTEQAAGAPGEAKYRYPTAGEIQADVAMESTAVAAAVSALSDSLDDCPLKDSLKVYAAVELAFKYGEAKYVEEVFSEVALFSGRRDG